MLSSVRLDAGARGKQVENEAVRIAAEWIADAHKAIAFTGAGVSTPSGIPDFRSPSAGLWEQADPMHVASIWGFRANPQAFYDWFSPLARLVLDAVPNAAHFALADLAAMGCLSAVITQNIDGLHQQAGSQRVLELHGHLRQACCIGCGDEVPSAGPIEELLRSRRAPRCRKCGGVLKPQVILFGELLSREVLRAAQDECQRCGVILVAGSSLEVAPASDLPALACRSGARLIIVNYQPTSADSLADLVIQGDVAAVLPAIVTEVRKRLAT